MAGTLQGANDGIRLQSPTNNNYVLASQATGVTLACDVTDQVLLTQQTSAMNSGSPDDLAVASKKFVEDTVATPTFTAPPIFPEHTVGTVPSAATYDNGVIIVSDEIGGRTLATSDGTNWRRVSDGVIIS